MNNDLSAWLNLLEQRHPVAIDLGLDRVRVVAEKLAVTRFDCPVVTVAGTNGKGSTVATLQALAVAHDLTVGVYTSPHLLHFNERIAIDGQAVTDADLLRAFAQVEHARGEVSLTYFEFTTLAALWLFKQQALDLLVLEVGMGGRLDAVNIVDADVAVITTIAKDHEAFLGNTLEKIAGEKAGICRRDKPVVIGDAQQIDLIAAAVSPYGAKIIAASRDYHFALRPESFIWQCEQTSLQTSPRLQLGPDLIAAALTAFRLALKQVWQNDAAAQAVQSANLMGRWQTVWSSPQTIVDIGHNPQAAKRLAQKALATGRPLHLVVGMLGDKDQAGSLAAFSDADADWYLADLNGPRACSAQTLADKLPTGQQQRVQQFVSPRAAWVAALSCATPDALILVWGSFLTVADVTLAAREKQSLVGDGSI